MHRTVQECFDAHDGRLVDKWQHYLPIYERYFAKFVGTACRVLEIGVGHGGSLQLWKAYFGHKAQIFGLDIDIQAAQYEESQITIFIGDQKRPPHLSLLDIVIDDGSHLIADQHASLYALWPHVRDGGVYLIEDCHEGYPEPLHKQGNCTSISYYPSVMVYEKGPVLVPERIIAGHPSRELNIHEREAYAQHLHPDL
ncbi:MAG TPA: class I SAM-dependent methyltransferase [Bryobacteraceae bacterium]|nr:class I SAM-dependent methyltransferase [Bryobacteraceae bacterium]